MYMMYIMCNMCECICICTCNVFVCVCMCVHMPMKCIYDVCLNVCV